MMSMMFIDFLWYIMKQAFLFSCSYSILLIEIATRMDPFSVRIPINVQI